MVAQHKFARKFRGRNMGRRKLKQLAYDLFISSLLWGVTEGKRKRQITGVVFL